MAACSNFSKRCKIVIIVVLIVYLLITAYSAYVLFSKGNIDGGAKGFKEPKDDNYVARVIERLGGSKLSTPDPLNSGNAKQFDYEVAGAINNDKRPIVDIWGKAAIGLYLWEYILGGVLDNDEDGFVQHGQLDLRGIQFRFRTGPGVVQGRVPIDVEYLVLVLNGHEEKKVATSRMWLDYLSFLPLLRGAAVVLLGSEGCDNDWLLPYMSFNGGRVSVAFLVYDSPLVDDRYFFQWPLGVATYRSFPLLEHSKVQVDLPRSHLCNFVGTVYPGSSREVLVQLINSSTSDCAVHSRNEWQPNESEESLLTYISTLLDSDLTLAPAGMNSECYRIYEALSCGSIPVVEDRMTEGSCGGPHAQPLRLLKAHRAPLIYVSNWHTELVPTLAAFRRLTDSQKTARRRLALDWYHNFTDTLRGHFVETIRLKLLSDRGDGGGGGDGSVGVGEGAVRFNSVKR